LAVVLGLLVWVWPPDVNESHYLTKAKHFWDSNWCQNDLFAASHPTHWLFYSLFGWMTRVLSLAATAWTGRCLAWLVVAWGLTRLMRVQQQRTTSGLLLVPLAVLLNRHCHWAGEWFVGGFEAKSIAWGFVFAALAFWMRRDWPRALLLVSIASGFHVVVGFWSLIAMLAASTLLWLTGQQNPDGLGERGETRKPVDAARVASIVLALVFLACGVIPALDLNRGSALQIVNSAAEIQAFWRLAHHQDALQFSAMRWIAFSGMTAIWMVLVRVTWPVRSHMLVRLNTVAFASLLLDAGGLILSCAGHAFPELRPFVARLLVLYWFRLADVLLPVALVCNAALWLQTSGNLAMIRSVAFIAAAIVAASIGWNAWVNGVDPRSGSARQACLSPAVTDASPRAIEADRNWRRTCQWIAEHSPKDAVFLTPAGQQTFKWYAGRAEVASWKDMPQDAEAVVAWKRRLTDLYEGVSQDDFGLLGLYDHEIMALADQYGADFLLVETRFVDWRESIGYKPAFVQVYPSRHAGNTTFTIFALGPKRQGNQIMPVESTGRVAAD
jgi:hypothetical protein